MGSADQFDEPRPDEPARRPLMKPSYAPHKKDEDPDQGGDEVITEANCAGMHRYCMSVIECLQKGHSITMKHTIKFAIALLPLLAFAIPACDSPDDEAELQELDIEDEVQAVDDAQESPESDLDLTANPKPTAAGCHFKVIWPSAGVYEQPASGLLKSKHSGDIVGDWCFTHYAGGNWWQAVTTASAQDGIGWMRSNALNPI